MTYKMIMEAETEDPAEQPTPYTGNDFVRIPEFPGIGNFVSQQYAAVITGDITVDQALEASQTFAERTMREAGYYDKK